MPVTFSEFCAQFGEPPEHIRIGKRYFSDPKGLAAMGKGWDVFSVGIFLGEDRHGFRPTSALIDLLAQQDARRVTVDRKATWLFLCGNDILMQGVRDPGGFAKGDAAIVADMEGHVLGFGRVSAAFDRKAKNRQYVKHVLDKGEYLRREK